MSGVRTEPIRAHASGAGRWLGETVGAIALAALFGCNSVLGIDEATLCDGACDAGVRPIVADDPRVSPGAPPAESALTDAGLDDPASSNESSAADLPLAPATDRAPADNASNGNGNGSASGNGNGNSRGNSGRGNAEGEANSGESPSGGGASSGPGNGSDDEDDTPASEPPLPPEPPAPQPPPSRCDGRASGEAFCDGSTRITCGAGGAVTNTLTCSSPAHCLDSSGPTCAACLTGDARCDGAVLGVCNPSNTGFDTQACASPAQCNAAQRRCDAPACQANQLRCDGAVLQRCNASLTGFDRVTDCGSPAACNVNAGSCNVCTPGTSRCVDESTVASCDPQGQSEVLTGCRSLIEACSFGRCELLGLPL